MNGAVTSLYCFYYTNETGNINKPKNENIVKIHDMNAAEGVRRNSQTVTSVTSRHESNSGGAK